MVDRYWRECSECSQGCCGYHGTGYGPTLDELEDYADKEDDKEKEDNKKKEQKNDNNK